MSAAPPTAAPDPAETLRAILARVDAGEDYYSLLGIARTAGDPEVQTAFVQWARVLHPDLPALRGDLRADATRAFQMLTRARLTLTDPQRRAEYLASLGEPPPSPQFEGPNPNLAKIHLHRARQLVTRRDWPQAEAALRVADQLFGDPFDPECRGELAWAIFNNHANPEHERMAQAKTMLEDVIGGKRGPAAVAQAHYYLSMWYKVSGDMGKVKHHLDQCTAINDKHVEAQRELRLFERRRSTSVQMPAAKAPERQPTRPSSTDNRRPSGAVPAPGQAAEVKKVPLEKKQSLLERLFGGKR